MTECDEVAYLRPSSQPAVDVVKALRAKPSHVLINYLPVGSEQAVKFYAHCCLEAELGMGCCTAGFPCFGSGIGPKVSIEKIAHCR